MHSTEAQEEVFNPKGEKSMAKVKLEEQKSVLWSRLNLVIAKWLKDTVVEENINEAHTKLSSTCNEILSGNEITMERLKLQLPKINQNKSTSVSVFKGPAIIQVILFLENYTASLSDSLKNLIFGKKFRLKTAGKRFKTMIEVFSEEDIQNIIEDSFGKQYTNAIDSIFNNMPNETNGSMQTIDEITNGKKYLKMKERELHQLQLIIGLFDNLHK